MSDPIQFVDPDDPGRQWRFETDFLASNWTCLWGRGCLGILDEPAEHLQQGCCSVGAELVDDDEAMMVAALGASLDPARFQHHVEAESGVIADELTAAGRRNTRVVDGACIFLNRPGFVGGAGCALHLMAVDADEDPHVWKPSVCWQLPVRVDYQALPDGSEIADVRRWSRGDWGDEGETMAWLCTAPEEREVADAFVGDRPVVASLEIELTEMLGRSVYVELTSRMSQR